MKLSNSSIVSMFKTLDPNDISTKNEIVESLSPLVFKNGTRYKKYPNYEDLIQEGFVGLIRAVNSFNADKFSNFISYADQWIIHYMRRSASRFDIVYNPNKVRVVYAETDTDDYNPDDVPDTKYEAKERANILKMSLKRLDKRERYVLKNMYGINTRIKTLKEVGSHLKISHERARQIKNKALLRLRKIISNGYGDLYE